jgi:hypothetical protein
LDERPFPSIDANATEADLKPQLAALFAAVYRYTLPFAQLHRVQDQALGDHAEQFGVAPNHALHIPELEWATSF